MPRVLEDLMKQSLVFLQSGHRPWHKQVFAWHFLKGMGKQGTEGNRAKQDAVGAEPWPGPQQEEREARLPLLGTLHKEPLFVKAHQLPPPRSRRPSKQKVSGKFSFRKVPRGPGLINDFRKIIRRWINIPQESYFWS